MSSGYEGAPPRIQLTILQSAKDTRPLYTLVQYQDGRFDVLRDGVPISTRPWSKSEFEDCVATFHRLGERQRRGEDGDTKPDVKA